MTLFTKSKLKKSADRDDKAIISCVKMSKLNLFKIDFLSKIIELLRFLYSTYCIMIENHHTEFQIDGTTLTSPN